MSRQDQIAADKLLDALMLRVLVFVDQNGVVVAKDSSPMHSSLTMKYKGRGLDIKMHATSYAQGNGSCGALVKYRGKKVFSAGGCYTDGPWDVEAATYKTGAWEKMINARSE